MSRRLFPVGPVSTSVAKRGEDREGIEGAECGFGIEREGAGASCGGWIRDCACRRAVAVDAIAAG